MQVNTIFIHKPKEEQILKNIESKLSEFYTKSDLPCSLNDRMSYVLFLAYRSLEKESSVLKDKMCIQLNICIDYFSSEATNSTILHGFTGLAWLIQHLYHLGLLEKSEIEILDQLDEFVEESCQMDYRTQNLDLLYGLIGKGFYFLERYPTVDTKIQLNKIFDYYLNLVNTKHLETSAFWEKETKYANNLGLAHGVPSIIVFLAKLYKKGIRQDSVYKELERLIKWLLKQKLEKEAISTFPINTDSKRASRLAWCYGDLSISIALQHALEVLKSRELQDFIIDVLEKSAQRDLSSAWIEIQEDKTDTSICHGIAGIAHIYDKFSQIYKNKEIKKAYQYWYDFLLQKIDLNEKKPDYTLLNGYTGVGLVLLSQQKLKSTYTWDSILLIDINENYQEIG